MSDRDLPGSHDAPPTRLEDGAGHAPATTLESAGAPPTRYEGTTSAAPPTRYEGTTSAAPPTRYEGGTAPAAPPTRYEPGGAGRRRRSPRRHRLPEDLEARFDYLHDLGGGGEGVVLLCRQRSDGQLVALKLYHSEQASFDPATLDSLRTTDPAHVAPILEAGIADERIWELQEYYPLGSIRDVAEREGLPLPPEDVRDFVREMTAAIAHLHARKIVHRDLKPAILFVRERRPLDCVIGDFGLARELVLSRHVGSVAGTFAYSSPEATWGKYTRASDWWSLGVVAHELLTGQHLFSDADGRLLPDYEVRVALNEGTWQVTGVTDPAFERLFAGLICDDPDQRWGAEQVTEWLAGGEPPVPQKVAPAPGAVGSGRRAAARMFFEGEFYATPEELAAGFATHFDAACDMVVGVKLSDLREWLHQTEVGTDADELLAAARNGTVPPARAMVELINILDPATPPVFRTAVLSPAGLGELCRRATAAQDGMVETITALRTQHILSAAAKRAPDGEELARVEARLAAVWKAAATFLDAAQKDNELRAWKNDAARSMEPLFLYEALTGDSPQLLERARQAAVDGAAEAPAQLRNWGNALQADDTSAAMVARAGVVMTLTPIIAAAVRAREAEERAAEAARAEAARVAAEEARRVEREAARQRRAAEANAARRRIPRRLVRRAIGALLLLAGAYWWANAFGAIALGTTLPFLAVTLGIPLLGAVLLSGGVDLVLPLRAGRPLSWMGALGVALPAFVAAGAAAYMAPPAPPIIEGLARVPFLLVAGYAAGGVLGAGLGVLAAPGGNERVVSKWWLVLPFLGLMAAVTRIGLTAAGVAPDTPVPDVPPLIADNLPTLYSLFAPIEARGWAVPALWAAAVLGSVVLFARREVHRLRPWLRAVVLLVAQVLGVAAIGLSASALLVAALWVGELALLLLGLAAVVSLVAASKSN